MLVILRIFILLRLQIIINAHYNAKQVGILTILNFLKMANINRIKLVGTFVSYFHFSLPFRYLNQSIKVHADTINIYDVS